MKTDLHASAMEHVGLGCMGFSHGYGPSVEHREALRLIRTAYEMGCTFFDTAEVYAAGANEALVGESVEKIPAWGSPGNQTSYSGKLYECTRCDSGAFGRLFEAFADGLRGLVLSASCE